MRQHTKQQAQKWYTRIIGIFFVLVLLTLITDYSKFGHRPETWHKIFHVLLGAVVLYYGWNNRKFWKPFALANGAFFAYIALFGLAFLPDYCQNKNKCKKCSFSTICYNEEEMEKHLKMAEIIA